MPTGCIARRFVAVARLVLVAALRRGARADGLAARVRRRRAFAVSRRTRRTIRRSVVGDLLAREEVFVKPAPWLQFAGGLDVRANTHDQVERRWRVDFGDRGVLRPRAVGPPAERDVHAAARSRVDAGKQFIRWGKTDIVTPTDRFAPRDFLNVVDTEFLP